MDMDVLWNAFVEDLVQLGGGKVDREYLAKPSGTIPFGHVVPNSAMCMIGLTQVFACITINSVPTNGSGTILEMCLKEVKCLEK